MSSAKCFVRSVLAPLSGLSHRWLGARPGGPGTQFLLALCLLLLSQAAVAAVPIRTIMSPTDYALNQNGFEAPGDAADFRWVEEDYSGAGIFVLAGVDFTAIPRCGTSNSAGSIKTACDARKQEAAVAAIPVRAVMSPTGCLLNQSSFGAHGGTADIIRCVKEDYSGAGIFHLAGIDLNALSNCGTSTSTGSAKLVSNARKQDSCTEAPGKAFGIRWGASESDHRNNVKIYIKEVERHLVDFNTFTSKKNPYKEASGGAAGIKRASYPPTPCITLPSFSISLSAYLPPVSAMAASTATSASTHSTPEPGQRSHLCSLPRIRETMTVWNRKSRLLETS